MTRLRRRLPLPAWWASVRGLWLTADGLRGAVVDDTVPQIVLFEGVRTITVDTLGWTVREIIACLSGHDTPLHAEPRIADLTEGDLQPLLACGALTRIEVLRLMAHVPGWQP